MKKDKEENIDDNDNISDDNNNNNIACYKKIKVDVEDGVVELPLDAMEHTKQSRMLSKFPDSKIIGKVCSYYGDGRCKNGNDCSFLHIKNWFLQFVKDNMGNN